MSDISKTKYNIRKDPFTEEDQSILCEKEELVIPSESPFYIQLEEAPKKEDPSTVAIYLTDTLAADLDASETIVTVANGAYWAINDVILVDDEQMLITGKSSNDLNVTRGYGGTTAATHTNGTRFRKLTAWTEVYTTPSQGEFQVHYGTAEIPYKRGLIRFHEDDGGKTVWVDYYKIGHYNWAEHINDLQTRLLTETYYGRLYEAGDILIISSDAQKDPASETSYAKTKEILINRSGILRIKFDMHVNQENIWGRIYRNGTAVGIARHLTYGDPWTTFSEDISGWSAGDLCQLYAYETHFGDNNKVRNFRLYTNFCPGARVTLD